MNKSGYIKYQGIAIIKSPFGLKGEVRLKPLSRYFEDYIRGSDLHINKNKSNSIPIKISYVKGYGKKRIFKLEGINSRIEAQVISGCIVLAKVALTDKINFISKDLINWKVVSLSKSYIGKLVDIMWCPGSDVYVVKNHDKEYLIPVVDKFIKKINYENREIVIDPINGLIE